MHAGECKKNFNQKKKKKKPGRPKVTRGLSSLYAALSAAHCFLKYSFVIVDPNSGLESWLATGARS